MSPFLFVKLVQQRHTQNHAKPAHRVCRSSGQPFTGTTRSAGVGGVWVSVSDIGRVGKKMVLRRIPIYFMFMGLDWLVIKGAIVKKAGQNSITIECIRQSPEGFNFRKIKCRGSWQPTLLSRKRRKGKMPKIWQPSTAP